MIIDVHNGFNEMIRLVMLWTVRHYYRAGASFAFSFYKHWEHLLQCRPGSPPVTLMSREGVTRG